MDILSSELEIGCELEAGPLSSLDFFDGKVVLLESSTLSKDVSLVTDFLGCRSLLSLGCSSSTFILKVLFLEDVVELELVVL